MKIVSRFFMSTLNIVRWGSFLAGLTLILASWLTAADAAELSTPRPIRSVVVNDIGTKPFRLPNGQQVDLNADLRAMLRTSLDASFAFSESDPQEIDLCERYLELRADVTTLEMEVSQFRVKFGYSPAGAIGTVSNITGEVGVRLGTVAMDFSVFECSRMPGKEKPQCGSRIASFSNQRILGTDVGFSVDFGQISTGGSFIHQTPLGEKLRKVMIDGVAKLASHTRYDRLYWQARVIDFDAASGEVTLDAGEDQALSSGNAFTVYGAIPAESGCPVHKKVAYLHNVSVDTVTSSATLDAIYNEARGILPGDRVMIRKISR